MAISAASTLVYEGFMLQSDAYSHFNYRMASELVGWIGGELGGGGSEYVDVVQLVWLNCWEKAKSEESFICFVLANNVYTMLSSPVYTARELGEQGSWGNRGVGGTEEVGGTGILWDSRNVSN